MTEAAEPDDEHSHHLRGVALGSLANLAGAGVAAISGLALVIVVTKLFSAHVSGQYFAATSAFLIVLSVASLGTEVGLARFVQMSLARRSHSEVTSSISIARRPVLWTSLGLAAVILVSAPHLAQMIGLSPGMGTSALRVLGLMLPVAAISTFDQAVTRAFGHMRYTVLGDGVFRPIAQVLGVLAVATLGAGLVGLAWSWVLPYVITAGVLAWIVPRLVGRPDKRLDEQERRDLSRAFWRFTWPRSVAQVLQLGLQRLDILLVSALLSPTHAAAYTVATRFVPLGQFVANAIQQALQPRIAGMFAAGQHAGAERVFRVSTAWGVMTTWPLYVTVAAAASYYLGIFGAEYRTSSGVTVVLVMAVGMMGATAVGTVDTMLLMAGRSAPSLVNSMAALVIDLGLCLLLIPRWGIVGAAVAWAVAVIARGALGVWQVKRLLDMWPFGAAWVYAVVASLVSFLAPLAIANGLGAGLPALLGVATGSVLLFAALLAGGRKLLSIDVVTQSIRRRPGAAAG